MVKVLVVGKARCLVRMTENTVEGFRQAGCDVARFALNGENRFHSLTYKLHGKWVGGRTEAVTRALEARVRQFRPDLIVFVLGAWMPATLYERARAAHPAAVLAAWVGDLFTPEQGAFGPHMDWLFCTDSYFMKLAREQGIATPSSYLPLAMDPARFHPIDVPRHNKLVYVAKHSPGRAAFIQQIQRPLALYGERWRRLQESHHEMHPREVRLAELPGLYASALAVLNIKNELNVVNGINQRSLEPYGCKTPVLNDAVDDIGLCLEPDREILIYHSVDELHAHYDRLAGDPAWARTIGEAGYRRVMAEHTYVHRAQRMLKEVGLA